MLIYALFYLDYCVNKLFRPECDSGKLILMQSALYGRMSLGKCVLTDLGYLGCKANVLATLDGLCTGQPSCNVIVNDEVIKPKGGCIVGLQSYLEVEYSCVEGLLYFIIILLVFKLYLE